MSGLDAYMSRRNIDLERQVASLMVEMLAADTHFTFELSRRPRLPRHQWRIERVPRTPAHPYISLEIEIDSGKAPYEATVRVRGEDDRVYEQTGPIRFDTDELKNLINDVRMQASLSLLP